ncbi:nuclear transport factor 2 family protein [Luteimonas kalidii]|uniref:Nuclear transport factor 2 family protein n=1 Tax=Luteimonas kalidii TaxID=3042025 RepID=A0ABT6JT19_9GAMM|nr:nuclear transport factor 2 family protein [Luteimonas kalidii]MDH5833281.1 nuclear transport factor 2 family protein [Luteimonas kalidii]
MRTFATFLTLSLLVPSLAIADDPGTGETVEGTVRRLDLAEAKAVLLADFDTVDKLWAQDMTVNNPFDQVVRSSGGGVRTGAVTYSSFVRNIESIQVHGDTAIAMGNEVVMPSGKSVGAGTTIRRRYTNIWMKRDGQWLLTARHANVICPN